MLGVVFAPMPVELKRTAAPFFTGCLSEIVFPSPIQLISVQTQRFQPQFN